MQLVSIYEMGYKNYVNRSSLRIDIDTHLAGRSIYWLAKTTGLPYSTVHKIARNSTDGISFIVLEKLCEVFECEPCQLIVKEKPNLLEIKTAIAK